MKNIGRIEISHEAILINEKPMFLYSAEFHYFQINPNIWEEKLQKISENGFNAITIYISWSFHEVNENKFDFSSSKKNIVNLFNLCKKFNLYILIRPGPRISNNYYDGGIPKWLIDKYPEILEKNSAGKISQSDYKNDKTSFICYLHPIYIEKVKKWYRKISAIVKNHQYPDGNIIIFQVDDDLLYNFQDQYFTFGYNEVNFSYYRDFLKRKYFLIDALNDAYDSKYSSFFEINPPLKPKVFHEENIITKKMPNKSLIIYLDWLECKEWILTEFISNLVEMLRKNVENVENVIKIPICINISSYKSPINTQRLLTYENLLLESSQLMIGFNYLPIVFHAQVNENCYTLWHTEWLKSHFHNLPFIAKFQEGLLDKNIASIYTHNLLRLSYAHGVRAVSFNFPPIAPKKSKNPNSKKPKKPDKKRYNEMKIFQQFIKQHGDALIYSKKTYDPLSLAYYHPVTRLKSFEDPLNSKSFSFPINYEILKLDYKNHLQLLSKHFIHYDVIDLEQITGEKLSSKPYIMLYNLSWMEHETMVLLANYVQEGGNLITFGDIPSINEFFEEDNTLMDLYLAKLVGRVENKKCIWMEQGSSKKIENISHLFYYDIKSQQNLRILAHEGGFRKIFAFVRQIGMGKVVHSGVMVSPKMNSLEYFELLFEVVNFPIKNVQCSKECVAIQNVTHNGERFLIIGNLKSTPVKNISCSFYNPTAKNYPKLLEIDAITLPSKVFSIWHAFKPLSQEVMIKYCTAEILEIKTHVDSFGKTYYINLSYPVTLSEKDEINGKICLIISKKSVKFEIQNKKGKIFFRESDVKYNNIEFKQELIEFFSPTSFSLKIEKEKYLFDLKLHVLEV